MTSVPGVMPNHALPPAMNTATTDDGKRDARGDDSACKRGHHALGVARHDLAVRVVEQLALVVLASIGLDGEDVGDGIRQCARERVLRIGRILVEREDSLVHHIRDDGVDDQQRHEDDHVRGHAGDQDDAGGDDGADDGEEGERDVLEHLRVGVHELGGLAHERAAKAVGVEGHGLVRERVERLGREVVARGDFELERRVVLHLAACLADEVDGDERDDVGAEHLEDLVGRDGRLAHAIDDHAHKQRIAIAEQDDKSDGGEHEAYE